MAYVYRYTDLSDGIIKYVGIVWSETRTLEQRINEHQKDEWCLGKKWKIEFICEDIESRTDAEYFESHYISLFKTDYWFNKSKRRWGISKYLPERNDWKIYKIQNVCRSSRKTRRLNSRQWPLWKFGKLYENKETHLPYGLYKVTLFRNGKVVAEKFFNNIYRCSDELKVSIYKINLQIKKRCKYITYGKTAYAIYNGSPKDYAGYCIQINLMTM